VGVVTVKSTSAVISQRSLKTFPAEIDACVEDLGKDRDVISVSVTPLTLSDRVPGEGAAGIGLDAYDTYTFAVVVTVVWRDH
jgi:hypothetical protein